MIKTDVLILGGGLAGLSTAHHLNRLGSLSALVVETGPFVGGTAGTERHGEFLFDHTGHLLHLHDAYGKKFILSLLKGNWALHSRSSWIHSQGVATRYPFQANTHGLPWPSAEDCVAGFLKTVHDPRVLPKSPSFRDWCLATFGAGISRQFMFPYNEKLWRGPLSRLTTEWQGRFVPKPAPSEVLYGALMDQKKFFGYNADFRYPVRGGMQVLPDALAAGLKQGQVRTNCAARFVDLASKTAVVENLGEVQFERLVNTMPLVDFLDLCRPLSASVSVARLRLRYNTVYNLNLGVERPRMSEKHWIYFPEKKYPFYRVGYSSNFSPHLAPRGASSLYIEVSRRCDEKVDLRTLENQVLSGLRSCGILKSSDKLLAKVWMPIRCAYVVYDFARTPAVAAIFKHLGKIGVESIGRYGAWKYSFMEETILDGKRCAERLLGLSSQAEKTAQPELKALK
ncbi:MAG: FAD-dependent oxidoreductase [Elusimicrobia bacterium]|nr:FAD-dependent oxidoreductase [Elusimicrobiota bacterium]